MICHRKELNTCRAKLINSLICKCLLFAQMQKSVKLYTLALHFAALVKVDTEGWKKIE